MAPLRIDLVKYAAQIVSYGGRLVQQALPGLLGSYAA
jgi:hypothetical protein